MIDNCIWYNEKGNCVNCSNGFAIDKTKNICIAYGNGIPTGCGTVYKGKCRSCKVGFAMRGRGGDDTPVCQDENSGMKDLIYLVREEEE